MNKRSEKFEQPIDILSDLRETHHICTSVIAGFLVAKTSALNKKKNKIVKTFWDNPEIEVFIDSTSTISEWIDQREKNRNAEGLLLASLNLRPTNQQHVVKVLKAKAIKALHLAIEMNQELQNKWFETQLHAQLNILEAPIRGDASNKVGQTAKPSGML